MAEEELEGWGGGGDDGDVDFEGGEDGDGA